MPRYINTHGQIKGVTLKENLSDALLSTIPYQCGTLLKRLNLFRTTNQAFALFQKLEATDLTKIIGTASYCRQHVLR